MTIWPVGRRVTGSSHSIITSPSAFPSRQAQNKCNESEVADGRASGTKSYVRKSIEESAGRSCTGPNRSP